MSGTVWSKFYWSDWESDTALRLCSLAAQGLWMRMLCIAAAHDPIGYVAVAGRGLKETDLARMTGTSESEVCALLGELERNGVFSRDRQRRIYSRRMLSDVRKSATARKNGRSGGNPTLRKDTVNRASDNHELKGDLKPHKPEARGHIPETIISSAADGDRDAAPLRDDQHRRYDDLEHRLRDAAGLTNSPSPDLLMIGPIVELLNAGCHLELDVLPVLRARGRPDVRTWRFFVGAIQDAKASRLAAGSRDGTAAPSQPGGVETQLAALADYRRKREAG